MHEPPNPAEASADAGSVRAIWIKRAKKGPMDPHERVAVVAGRGLEGNANQGRKRQVTFLSVEAWTAAEAQLGKRIDPANRRANVLVTGLDLRDTRGRLLRIGTCRFEIRGETRPCRRMEDAHPGLEDALSNDWRGGIYGVALDDGEIAVGDPAAWC